MESERAHAPEEIRRPAVHLNGWGSCKGIDRRK